MQEGAWKDTAVAGSVCVCVCVKFRLAAMEISQAKERKKEQRSRNGEQTVAGKACLLTWG